MTIPSRSIQNEINEMRRALFHPVDIAESLGLPIALVRDICEHQRKVAGASSIGLTYFGERRVRANECVRCPECRARLQVVLPGHACAACELRREMGGKRGGKVERKAG